MTRGAQNNDTQRWVLATVGPNTSTIRQRSRKPLAPISPNTFTIRQLSSGRFLDAHEIAAKDFGVVTRPAQNDATQQWLFAQVGTVFTMQKRSSNRFVDAHEIVNRDFAVVTPAPRATTPKRQRRRAERLRRMKRPALIMTGSVRWPTN